MKNINDYEGWKKEFTDIYVKDNNVLCLVKLWHSKKTWYGKLKQVDIMHETWRVVGVKQHIGIGAGSMGGDVATQTVQFMCDADELYLALDFSVFDDRWDKIEELYRSVGGVIDFKTKVYD